MDYSSPLETDNEDQETPDDESVEISIAVDTPKLQDFFELDKTGRVFVPKANIAELIPKGELDKIGRYVKEGYDADVLSMKAWTDNVELGLDLNKQERNTKETPYPGAANFKSPLLINACLTFGDRASTELLRAADLCQVNVVGKDDQDIKKAKAERVETFQNWQLNSEMPEWRDEQEKLLYDLPHHGTVFKEAYYDSELGRLVSDLVAYPAFAVNNSVKSQDKLRRFSKIFEYPKNVVREKMNSGIWLDVELSYAPDDSDEDQYERDQIHTFIQQQTFCDLDDDGYEEPYTVVIHEATSKVVRITPRFYLKDAVVKAMGQDVNLNMVMMAQMQGMPVDDIKVIRITPNSNTTMYGFLPDPQGGFLFVGYCGFMASLVGGVNVTTNTLLNAGEICSIPSGYAAKEFRIKQGDAGFKPGELKQSGISARDLQSSILLNKFPEPSQVLYALLQSMEASIEKTGASADLKGALGQNSPAATTLAMVQEQQLSTGAIIQRVYRSMSKEFDVMFKLNSKFTDPQMYMRVVNDPNANFEQDFDPNDLDIVPSANPEISSKIQRIQQAQAEMANLEAVVNAGGNPRPIVENYYKTIGATNIDDIFPPMTPEQQLQDLLKRNPQLQDQITQMSQTAQMHAQLLLEKTQAETELTKAKGMEQQAKAQRNELSASVTIHETAQKLDKLDAETDQIQSKTVLNIAQAEALPVKTSIDVYNAAVQTLDNNPQEISNEPGSTQ